MNLYVYYDVPHAVVGLLLPRVQAMQARLGHPAGRLLRRDPVGTTSQTWMEIYERVPTDFEARLGESVEAHGLATLAGPRHVERFLPLD